MCLFTWLKRLAGEVPLFFHFVPFCFLFPSLLSFVLFFCLICFLPEGETIFWISPALINGCQQLPCSAESCSEWQIILCHTERERQKEREREMLAACLSLLVASVIATASHLHRSTSEKVCHLGCYLVQTQLLRSATHVFFLNANTHAIYVYRLHTTQYTTHLFGACNDKNVPQNNWLCWYSYTPSNSLFWTGSGRH